MKITEYTIEKLNDPTGILEGERYEIFLTLEVDEDDELYSENGLTLRVIYAVDDNGSRMSQYQFIEGITNNYLDFALEKDEEALVNDFCQKIVVEE